MSEINTETQRRGDATKDNRIANLYSRLDEVREKLNEYRVNWMDTNGELYEDEEEGMMNEIMEIEGELASIDTPVPGMALARTCDVCGRLRAYDHDCTLGYKRELMQRLGQTVREVTTEQLQEMIELCQQEEPSAACWRCNPTAEKEGA